MHCNLTNKLCGILCVGLMLDCQICKDQIDIYCLLIAMNIVLFWYILCYYVGNANPTCANKVVIFLPGLRMKRGKNKAYCQRKRVEASSQNQSMQMIFILMSCACIEF